MREIKCSNIAIVSIVMPEMVRASNCSESSRDEESLGFVLVNKYYNTDITYFKSFRRASVLHTLVGINIVLVCPECLLDKATTYADRCQVCQKLKPRRSDVT